MTAGINQIMTTAKGSLAANQMGLSTTAHNVSNVNTEGYSRQRVDFVSEDPTTSGRHQVGTGVRVKSVTRSHSEYLSRRMEAESSEMGRLENSADIFQQLENIFKNEGETGLSDAVSKFFNDIRSLSAQPESPPLKSAVKESAAAVTARFRTVSSSIDQVKADIDNRIKGAVENINSLTSRIASLNGRIMELSARGLNPNDELDSRDVAVQHLAKLIPVNITPVENNGINLASGRVGILVNGIDSFKLNASRAADSVNPGGAMHVYVSPEQGSAQMRDVTEYIGEGAVGGLLKVRDHFVPKIVNKVDTLAYELSRSVNDVHRQGFTRNGKTGVNFFKELGNSFRAAERLDLSAEVSSNINNISTGTTPNAPGDNRILLKMADLQDARIFEGGTSNFIDFNASIVGTLGVDARSINNNLENQRDMMSQLNTLREQTSGVSLDEEGIDMLKYQKAFDASAKMIQVADSMMDTILSLKRF